MAKFHIPDSLLSGFEKVALLTDDQVNLILQGISESTFGEGLDKLSLSLNQQDSSLESSEYKSILASLYSIMRIDELGKDAPGKERVFANFIDSVIEDSNGIDINKSRLEVNLKKFISLKDSVEETLKGYELLRENEKNYQDSRVITDVRFIFKDDISKTSSNKAVIVHRLKIDYSEQGETNTTYLALDNNDVQELIKTLQRASNKEELLRSDSNMQNINFLDLETEKD